MPALELEDIQGLVVNGYSKCASSRYLLLRFSDGAAAKRWLAGKWNRIQNGADLKAKQPKTCVNMAFTHSGLAKLGLEDGVLEGFSREFQEGMAEPTRSRILGDTGGSHPESWAWGGPGNPPVDALLLLFATDETKLAELEREWTGDFSSLGIEVLRPVLETTRLDGNKEHFGFADGASQPAMEGFDDEGPAFNRIKPGEFLLGYENEYRQYTLRPLVAAASDPHGLLPPDGEGSGRMDLGRNGSYLVFRQLYQDVNSFWGFLDQAARTAGSPPHADERVNLAAKMVGRWPNGSPLALCPHHADPAMAKANDFLYAEKDPDGHACPLGSHIRRTHPRDFLPPEPGSEDAIAIAKRHRILRRGRSYGPPVAASMAPAEILAAPKDGTDRGLHFLCFNGNIRRQFEFIQQTWGNNRKFSGLYSDPDPILGDNGEAGGSEPDRFTVQGEPVARRLNGLPRFVQVKGGAYFFMPGLRALRYLASL